MDTGVTMYKSVDGNQGVYVLRRIKDGKIEFPLISFFFLESDFPYISNPS